ncbi:MAG TPA: four helix bundle protein [Candidatus Eisenbacteria bacterium]|jgi:four helix bundle protein|nr:four helix bundle protein [Candidatus Eisenbacteria bacterium]
MSAASFRQLRIWEEAFSLAREVYVLTRSFPKEELFGLTSQVRRSANSVAANIAEGSGRSSSRDYERFLFMARGSARETMHHLLLAQTLDLMNQASTERLLTRYQGLDAGIHACIMGLKRTKRPML